MEFNTFKESLASSDFSKLLKMPSEFIRRHLSVIRPSVLGLGLLMGAVNLNFESDPKSLSISGDTNSEVSNKTAGGSCDSVPAEIFRIDSIAFPQSGGVLYASDPYYRNYNTGTLLDTEREYQTYLDLENNRFRSLGAQGVLNFPVFATQGGNDSCSLDWGSFQPFPVSLSRSYCFDSLSGDFHSDSVSIFSTRVPYVSASVIDSLENEYVPDSLYPPIAYNPNNANYIASLNIPDTAKIALLTSVLHSETPFASAGVLGTPYDPVGIPSNLASDTLSSQANMPIPRFAQCGGFAYLVEQKSDCDSCKTFSYDIIGPNQFIGSDVQNITACLLPNGDTLLSLHSALFNHVLSHVDGSLMDMREAMTLIFYGQGSQVRIKHLNTSGVYLQPWNLYSPAGALYSRHNENRVHSTLSPNYSGVRTDSFRSYENYIKENKASAVAMFNDIKNSRFGNPINFPSYDQKTLMLMGEVMPSTTNCSALSMSHSQLQSLLDDHWQGLLDGNISGVSPFTDEHFSLAPNPIQEGSTIRIVGRREVEIPVIEVFNFQGRKVMTDRDYNKTLDVSLLPLGVYFVSINRQNLKLVIQ